MNIAIIGKGGHSKVVEDIILSNKECKIVSYLDDRYEEVQHIDGKYYGPISAIDKLRGVFNDLLFVIAIGNNRIRKRIVEQLGLFDHDYATLIHQNAIVSPSTRIGNGTVVMASAVINAEAEIGRHVIINTNSVVEHDNKIDDFVHISPGAILTGAVSVGEGSHVGAGAVVIPNVQIGEWSILGAGATAIKNIPPNSTAVGVPAKIINKKPLEVSEI